MAWSKARWPFCGAALISPISKQLMQIPLSPTAKQHGRSILALNHFARIFTSQQVTKHRHLVNDETAQKSKKKTPRLGWRKSKTRPITAKSQRELKNEKEGKKKLSEAEKAKLDRCCVFFWFWKIGEKFENFSSDSLGKGDLAPSNFNLIGSLLLSFPTRSRCFDVVIGRIFLSRGSRDARLNEFRIDEMSRSWNRFRLVSHRGGGVVNF